MSKIQVSKKNNFSLFDKLDEDQIMQADAAVKQAMVYQNKKGHKEITYVGLKHIVLEMATKGNPLQIIKSECRLDKDDPEDKDKWIWRADVIVKSKDSGHEASGFSECPYMEEIKEWKDGKVTNTYKQYDFFGRIKALSKAERNAWRKQIPELVIVEMLKAVTEERTQKIDTDKVCNCGAQAFFGKSSKICLKCGGKKSE